MDNNIDIQIEEALKAYVASGVEDQVDYQKFYLYSIVTHSTAIEGSTVTEIENQLLFDEGIAAKGRSTIHPWVDGNGRTTRLVMNMIQRQLGLVPSIVRKEDKGEYIQSLVDSRENEDSTIAQDTMLRHHINNLNHRVSEYRESLLKDY